jgi:tetratricopeptide (TPR) repeat protein
MRVVALTLLVVVWLSGCYRPRDDVQVVLRGGVTLADAGDHHGAIAAYNEVVRREPQNAEAIYLRGTARDRLGDRTGAMSDYDAALRLNPALLPAYVARAAAHTALGNHRAAATDYDTARRLMGNDQIR